MLCMGTIIGFYLWKELRAPPMRRLRLRSATLEQKQAKINRALEQLRHFPESGPVKAGVIRKMTIPDSRYTMAYRITKNFKRVAVLSIRGAQKPIKW